MPRQLPPARFGRRAAQFSCPRHPGVKGNAPDPAGKVCCLAYAEEIERAVDKAWRHEMAMEAGMGMGIDAYNDMLGQGGGDPGPCGHHCHSDCPRCGERNTGRRAKAKAKQPMTARRRGALLQKLGYEKLPFVMTRGTTTWVYKETRAKVTIVNGGKGDDPFQILGGPYGFTSAFLFVENMAPGAWSKLLQWQRSGEVDVPSFEHDAMMDAFMDDRWPQPKDIPVGWLDDLFVALVTSSAAPAKRLKMARVDWDGGKNGQTNRGRRARLPLFIRRE